MCRAYSPNTSKFWSIATWSVFVIDYRKCPCLFLLSLCREGNWLTVAPLAGGLGGYPVWVAFLPRTTAIHRHILLATRPSIGRSRCCRKGGHGRQRRLDLCILPAYPRSSRACSGSPSACRPASRTNWVETPTQSRRASNAMIRSRDTPLKSVEPFSSIGTSTWPAQKTTSCLACRRKARSLGERSTMFVRK
jgi:hypothetical protein